MDVVLLAFLFLPMWTNRRKEDVQIALAQLKSMGYEDVGGWLTELIRAKEGDVSKVLDALLPSGPRKEMCPKSWMPSTHQLMNLKLKFENNCSLLCVFQPYSC